jgi:hypothetical protein
LTRETKAAIVRQNAWNFPSTVVQPYARTSISVSAAEGWGAQGRAVQVNGRLQTRMPGTASQSIKNNCLTVRGGR